MQTSLKILSQQQKEILYEMQQQTLLLQQCLEVTLSNPGQSSPAASNQQHPLVITAADLIVILGVSKGYAPRKLRDLKKKLDIPLECALSIENFCRVTRISYDKVCRMLGYL